jgi:hypothetical protein
VVPCFAAKDWQQPSKGQDKLTRRLTTEGPAKFKLYILAAGLEGMLENFYSEKTFYEAFTAEGMRNCAQRQP